MKDFAQYTSRLPSPSKNKHGSPGSNSKTTESDMSGQGGDTDATIQNLKKQLQEAMSRDATAKAALSKSDAVILDLRSNQRQLKRQLDLLQDERSEINRELQAAKKLASAAAGAQIEGGASNTNNLKQLEQQIESLQAHIRQLTQQLEASKQKQKEQQDEINSSVHSRELDNNKNAKVGELQVQLDRAHAQILTADMVRKELEDTLEAEQYTWELRVQDQERQIARLQQECDTLARDLEQCRSQWKEAEVGWNEELNQLKDDLARAQRKIQQDREHGTSSDVGIRSEPQRDLMRKIHQLESERAELQSCLDEALKELEAVDAELRIEGDSNKPNSKQPNDRGILSVISTDEVTDSLKHLLRWICQEGPVEHRLDHSHLSSLRNPQEIISLVQDALEGWLQSLASSSVNKQSFVSAGRDQQSTIDRLTNDIAGFEDEIKNREQVNAELRESLKEAVSLLKPLQDAVAQTEEEKNALQQTLQDLERDRKASQDEISQQNTRINNLEGQISVLKKDLEDEKSLSSAHESLIKAQAHRSAGGHLSSPNSGIDQSDDDNDSLANIKRAREELRRKRETEGNLQKLLKDAQSRYNKLQTQNMDVMARNRELEGQMRVVGMENENKSSRELDDGALVETLARRDEEVRHLRLEIENMRKNKDSPTISKNNSLNEDELVDIRGELAQKEHVNKVLNKSLKEALGLLKPLQTHLEEAEREKTEIAKELRNLRKRFRQLQMGEPDDQSRSTITGIDNNFELNRMKDELEETVRQLELENSELHNALEDLTEDGRQQSNEAKMRQRLVELNSRYEVTQNKLEDAHVENHALVKALKQKELEESKRKEEMTRLEENLRKSQTELINAKRIAQSALVKVEELTMSNIEQLSISRDASTVEGETMQEIQATAKGMQGRILSDDIVTSKYTTGDQVEITYALKTQ